MHLLTRHHIIAALALSAAACGPKGSLDTSLAENLQENETFPAAKLAAGLSLGTPRGADKAVSPRDQYNYVPSAMKDGVYKVWWCAGLPNEAGDHILYAESDSLDGGWHAHDGSADNQVVFRGAFNLSNPSFDAISTCDPSVVRANGKYFMYGIHNWQRLNGGDSIIKAARPNEPGSHYGAGQPSVIFLEGLFYLIYTDTTGYDRNPVTFGAQFVLRSPDPTFQTHVEELGAKGFAPYSDATHTRFSPMHAISIDWQYSDALKVFIVANHGIGGRTDFHFYNRAFQHLVGPLALPGQWIDGPGLVSRPDKHALPGATPTQMPLDVMQGYYDASVPVPAGSRPADHSQLSHVGVDLNFDTLAIPAQLGPLYEGMRPVADGLPAMVVVNGRRLQLASSQVADMLSRNKIGVSRAVYLSIPYGASLHIGEPAVSNAGRPAAFLDREKSWLWPTDCTDIFQANGSSPQPISREAYSSHYIGGNLRCLR
jgi:hypothetical protein